jgi:hypothetical protein
VIIAFLTLFLKILGLQRKVTDKCRLYEKKIFMTSTRHQIFGVMQLVRMK